MVLTKAIGMLCTHLLGTLCEAVLSIDDIVANDASHIADIIERAHKHIQQRLFTVCNKFILLY